MREHRRVGDISVNNSLTTEQRMILMEQSLTSVQNSVIEQHSVVDRHHKLLIEGNGDLSILERLRNLETFVGTLRFWLRTVAVAIVLQTIAFSIATIVYFIRLLPLLDKLANP